MEGHAIRSVERGRRRGVDFYIYPTNSVERKALLDALKDLVVQASRCLPNSMATHWRAEAIGRQAGIVHALDATGVGEVPLTQKKVRR